MSKFRIKIPPEVRAAVRKSVDGSQKVPPVQKPKCWKVLDELSKWHEHDQDGNCILKNWSGSEVWKSPLGSTWTGPASGNRRLGDPTGAKKRNQWKG